MADGRVLIAGGRGSAGVVNTAELYNSSGTFEAAAPMAQARSKAACAALPDGRVLVAGGSDGDRALDRHRVRKNVQRSCRTQVLES